MKNCVAIYNYPTYLRSKNNTNSGTRVRQTLPNVSSRIRIRDPRESLIRIHKTHPPDSALVSHPFPRCPRRKNIIIPSAAVPFTPVTRPRSNNFPDDERRSLVDVARATPLQRERREAARSSEFRSSRRGRSRAITGSSARLAASLVRRTKERAAQWLSLSLRDTRQDSLVRETASKAQHASSETRLPSEPRG